MEMEAKTRSLSDLRTPLPLRLIFSNLTIIARKIWPSISDLMQNFIAAYVCKKMRTMAYEKT
jgi:hypothetical protein